MRSLLLTLLKREVKEIKAALLIDEEDSRDFEIHLQRLDFKPTVYSPHFSHINKSIITQCKSNNILLIPWTVNDRQHILELKKAGVDGVISDDPNLFREIAFLKRRKSTLKFRTGHPRDCLV